MMTGYVGGQRVHYSRRGLIYYNPRDIRAAKLGPPRPPLPPFCPRRRRPHTIHITCFPAGFTFCDLGPANEHQHSRLRAELNKLASRENAKRLLGSVFPSIASSKPSSTNNPTGSSSSSTSNRLSEISIPSTSISAPPTTTTTGATSDEIAPPVNMARNLYSAGDRGSSTTLNGSDVHRNSVASQMSRVGSVEILEMEKPLASSNGVSIWIQLAEPTVYVAGFDHDGHGTSSQSSASVLRGKLVLVVTKSVKLKAITMTFQGKARTEWPEGIPPQKTNFFEEEKLRYQVLPFYNAMYADSDTGYGARCTYKLKDQSTNSSSINLSLPTVDSPRTSSPNPVSRSSRSTTLLSGKDMKRLSLQANHSRSFSKNDSAAAATPQQKGYKIFHPGNYEYSFEISLDHTWPETMKLPLGSVTWQLEALIERAGTFKQNIHGIKDVTVVRTLDQNSLELVEPIAISRVWEDQLHYEIVISGKSFPLGSKIPVAFKLTPLAKVQCHRIKIFITENVEYFCLEKKVQRRDQSRKILLLERVAGKPVAKEYTGSEVRTVSGGELTGEARQRARSIALARRQNAAQRDNTEPQPLPEPADNLLGDIDLGLEHLVSQTELEMDVQLPTCEEMARDRAKTISPDTTWKNIQVHHWIKIVMRLSRADPTDPTGTKRRHFEISIDSPFHILSCLATQAHTDLPEYSRPEGCRPNYTPVCGCPNAAVRRNSSPLSSTNIVPTLGNMPDSATSADAVNFNTQAFSLTVPSQAHLPTGAAVQRPIHMLRNPSFNPPPFEAEEPPPPAETPPPMYDHVIGTPSHDGLADYFARLADYDDEHVDSEDDRRNITRTGRVNVVNPNAMGRLSRSMDIDRDFLRRAMLARGIEDQPLAPTTVS